LFKVKEGENFNHRNTLSILRIALKLHCVPKFEPDTEIEQNGVFFKGLKITIMRSISLQGIDSLAGFVKGLLL